MDDWQTRRRRRNRALALTLLGLVAILYVVSYVRTSERETLRHQEDPQAHPAPSPKAPP